MQGRQSGPCSAAPRPKHLVAGRMAMLTVLQFCFTGLLCLPRLPGGLFLCAGVRENEGMDEKPKSPGFSGSVKSRYGTVLFAALVGGVVGFTIECRDQLFLLGLLGSEEFWAMQRRDSGHLAVHFATELLYTSGVGAVVGLFAVLVSPFRATWRAK